jgi:hypothetical protein
MKKILAEINEVITALENQNKVLEANELNDVFIKMAQFFPAYGPSEESDEEKPVNTNLAPNSEEIQVAPTKLYKDKKIVKVKRIN